MHKELLTNACLANAFGVKKADAWEGSKPYFMPVCGL